MRSKLEYTFDFPLDAVVGLYASKEFVEGQFQKSGDEYVVAELVEREDYFKMRVERLMDMQSRSTPGALKKMVGKEGKFITTTEWDLSNPEKVVGTTELGMDGIPVGFVVKTTLTARGDKTLDESRIEVKAKIPVMGKQVEKFLLPKAVRGVERNFARAIEALEKTGK